MPILLSMKFIICSLLLAIAFVQPAFAQEVRVSGLQTVDYGVWDSSVGGTAFINVDNLNICAWKENIGNARYWITADDGNVDGVFQMDDGLGNTIDFQIRWQRVIAGGWTTLAEGVARRFNTADRDALVNDCSNSAPSAKSRIRMRQNAPSGNPPGIYRATLNILMIPD